MGEAVDVGGAGDMSRRADITNRNLHHVAVVCVCVCVFQVATGNVSDRKASVTASVPELCRPDSRSSDASDLNASTVRLVHAELPIRLVDY